MDVHITERIASGARFVAPRLLEHLEAYRDESVSPVLDAAGLRVPVTIEVGEHVGSPPDGARIRLSAKDHAERFPVFEGTLRIVPVTTLDSHLVLDGRYEVPLGLLGRLADRTVLRTTAEASLARLMAEMKAALSAAILENVIRSSG
jgi:hypothetical protein